jgi:tRNA pseudouridine38-40 synthase
VLLAYEGHAYKGWQIQPDVPTVQGTIEAALERVLGQFTRIHASGRTDTGVSALGQVIHFATDRWIFPAAELAERLRAALPPDITIRSLDEVPDEFHSRYDATRKHYHYTVCNMKKPYRKPALPNVYYFARPLAVELMRQAAAHLLGRHDFSSFGVNPGRAVETPAKTLMRCDIAEEPPMITFDLVADGFLYKMVRSIVGTLLKVGIGSIRPEEIPEILDARDRRRAGPTAPPYGLCLVEVFYD